MNQIADFPDWVSVVAFYSALHYVEAYLAMMGIHRIHHEERNRDVSMLMQDIENEYLNLYDLSRNSRYQSIGDMPSVAEARESVNSDLTRIEDFVRSHI